MSLNTKQKLAVTAVIGGLATLVYAGSGTLINSNGQVVKVVDNPSQPTTSYQQPIQPTVQHQNMGGQGPAARTSNGMIPRDIPANDSMGQFINHGNNFNSNSMPVSGVKDCQYSQDAIKAGVKHYRFADANPADLVDIGGSRKLHREAAAALRELQAAARADGVTLTVGSAWRDSAYQRGIVARKKAAGQSDAQIYKVSSAPGYSEHHTGYALDFTPINNGFTSSKAYTWLRQHGNEHGWYQSFTPESTRDTHVAVESWHWKYKGTPNAVAALANDACY